MADDGKALDRTARAVGLSAVMLLASAVMLIAAVVSLALHAVTLGGAFLALMILCGVTGFAAAVRSRSRARAYVRARQDPLP
jgi:hypothetical protein